MRPDHPLIRLRRPKPADVEARMALGTCAEITRMYGTPAESTPRLSRDDAANWYGALVAKLPHAWVIEVDGHLAGQARVDTINTADRRARLSIGLLHQRFLGRGIGRRAMELLLQEAFGALALHRIDLRVLAFNTRAIRCYEACGFTRDGIERESALVDGEWHDDWIMSLLEHEYRARYASRS